MYASFELYFSRKLWNDFDIFGSFKLDFISTGIIFSFFWMIKSTSALALVRQYFTSFPLFTSSAAIKFLYTFPLSFLSARGWKSWVMMLRNPLSTKNIFGDFTSSVFLLV